MTNTVKLLRELIALPSVNPAYLSPADPYAGEERVAEFLAAVAAGAGLGIEFQAVCAKRANLLARLTSRGKAQHRVVLAPHMDTVGGAEMPGKLFTPRIIGDRLFGRGACDTKGSIAVMLSVLAELALTPQRPTHTEILLACLVDEECGQRGSRALAASGLKADLAIVGEPTRLKVVTAHKGVMWYELKTVGKAAHGARPELGRNAVHSMARIVKFLLEDYAAQLKHRRHPLLGPGTISVGSIHGGRQPNIVPNECVCTIDRRIVPGETDAKVVRDLKHLFKRQGLAAQWRSLQPGPCLPLETDARQPLVRQFLQAARQNRPAGVDYFSDAGVLAHGGMPSVVFGPGDIAQAHTAEEWIALDQLEQGKALMLRFLQSLP
jgi:acetylornithine deacetylase/succinyl-diaminopimelate desuccinylase-like protein